MKSERILYHAVLKKLCHFSHKEMHKPREMRQKWICEDCFSVYLIKSDLKKHRKICKDIDQEVEMFGCKFCDKQFSRKDKLNQHIKFVHEKVRNYVCEICDRTFFTPDHVNRHKETVHSTVRLIKVFVGRL
jgi:Zinc finger, C2H2 type/C2H2-type zinc finger